MRRYICENVFVPLRSGPSHKSEMLSQVLFGEKYTINDQIGHWYKIETIFDDYEGWIDMNHIHHSEDRNNLNGSVLNRSLACFRNDGTRIVLEAGCEIYSPDSVMKRFHIGDNEYTTDSDPEDACRKVGESLSETALRFINSPYIWGGRIPSGIDCSGLVQLVYKIHGVKIARDSWKQAEEGKEISFIGESRPGDLVFFENDHGKISHVGMILSEGLVIHASGRVRIDIIDRSGIYKKEKNDYSHRLKIIKRIIDI